MASGSKNGKTFSSPDLILEVESIAGDSECGRRNDSSISESVSVETETIIGDENYANEMYCDDASAGNSETDSEAEMRISTANPVSLPSVSYRDRPQKFTINLLHDWCLTNKLNIDLAKIEPGTFDEILCRFYPEIRSKSGHKYSRNTVMAIRYGLNRYFASMDPPRKIDIIEDAEFKNSNEVFKAVVRNAAKENPEKACPRISACDLRKLYNSNVFSPNTPLTLLFKVWFEVSVYFNRKRSKLQRDTKITDFLFDVDSDGRRFATEFAKDEKQTQFRMYEKVGDWMCPVSSLEKLLSKIDPNCQYLFQRPRQVVQENAKVWYYPERIGRNYAAQIMGRISKMANLDDKYTNVAVKKLTAWSLEELIFQHRHLVSKRDNTERQSPIQHESETPYKTDGQNSTSAYSASGVSRAILPVHSTRSIACSTKDQHKGAFRPYVRKRTHSSVDREVKPGPDPIDVNTAKAKVKRIFQRLEYPDLVTLVEWLKRIDVLKDTSGTVFCHENCPRSIDQPVTARRFTPCQIQPLPPTQTNQPSPFILPSPLSVSQYLMNNAVNNTNCEPRPAAIYVPNFPFTTQTLSVAQHRSTATTQAGAIRSRNDRSRQIYSGIPNTGSQFPNVRKRLNQTLAPRQAVDSLPGKKTSTIASFQLSTILPSLSPMVSEKSVTPASGTVQYNLVQQSSAVTDDSDLDSTSPQKKLKISSVTGESKVWKIL